jgi:hypothetical protein
VDEEDPEKRIADLERQLAERKRGIDLPPASPHQAAALRRFVASPAPPTSTQMYKFMYGALAAYIALTFVIAIGSMALGPSIGSIAYALPTVFAFGLLVIGGLVLFLRFPRFWGREDRRKEILISVASDGLTVDQRPRDVFTFGDARLGLWIPAGIVSITMGAALHLRCGSHRFVLGGRDHRIATGTRLDAPPAPSVDAWMWAPDFAELLTMVGRRSGLGVPEPSPGEPIRCVLYPNASKLFAYSGLGVFNNARTLRQLQTNPPQPSLAMDVGKDAIWVTDLNTNALMASAWLAQVTATPAENRTDVYRGGTWTMPILVVGVPGLRPLAIGCGDSPDPAWPRVSYSLGKVVEGGVFRFSWQGAVRRENQPDYVVSGADWLTLVEKFGLARHLEDTANRGQPNW